MNTINWKPKALKQLEKSRKPSLASGFILKRKPWLISLIAKTLKSYPAMRIAIAYG